MGCHRGIGELQEIPIRVRNYSYSRLTTDPTPHVDITVGRPGAVRIDIETNAGVAVFAVATLPSRDIERHRDEITDLNELDLRSFLYEFARRRNEAESSGAVVRSRTMCWSGPQMLVETTLSIRP